MPKIPKLLAMTSLNDLYTGSVPRLYPRGEEFHRSHGEKFGGHEREPLASMPRHRGCSYLHQPWSAVRSDNRSS